MINHALSTDGTNLQTQATFGYDGAGNRLQQVDYTGGTPATTTYANDIQGLAQVLIADDGTTQTANLFGFDLIHQQSNQVQKERCPCLEFHLVMSFCFY